VVFYFFRSVGVKVSCVDMGFVGGGVRVRGESIEKFPKIAFSREMYILVKWNASL